MFFVRVLVWKKAGRGSSNSAGKKAGRGSSNTHNRVIEARLHRVMDVCCVAGFAVLAAAAVWERGELLWLGTFPCVGVVGAQLGCFLEREGFLDLWLGK
jgi:hypothetical protein